MSIATKTGDGGSTGLMYNRRVAKTDARVEAYGTVDELNAALGVVRASAGEPFLAEPLLATQRELVILMGELAVLDEDRERYVAAGYKLVEAPMVDRLTALVDDLEKNHRITYKGWATPGATALAAALDVARTVCRRGERRVAALPGVNPEILRYLNRLSDLLWLYARWVETRAEPPETPGADPA
jgi:cob(I)alamin adenosyltransferase